jgi:hypothetical protein
MKTLNVLLLLASSSCATVVSDYNQGCRDGMREAIPESEYNQESVNQECGLLDGRHASQNVTGYRYLGK